MFLLFDIGGTKTRMALAKDGRTFSQPEIFATPSRLQEALPVFKRLAQLKIKTVVGGIAGLLDKNKTQLARGPHLKGWEGQPLKPELQKIFKAKIYLENDTALVGLGEARYGAGQDYRIVAYLTISTGIGGVRIVDGKIDKNALGFEPGHSLILDCRDCKNFKDCQNFVELEDLISGSAIENGYGQKPEEIKDKRFWNKIAKILALGVYNTILYWSPEAVILGGSMMKSIPLAQVQLQLRQFNKILPQLPTVKKAKLGDLGGLYGALAYLKTLSN